MTGVPRHQSRQRADDRMGSHSVGHIDVQFGALRNGLDDRFQHAQLLARVGSVGHHFKAEDFEAERCRGLAAPGRQILFVPFAFGRGRLCVCCVADAGGHQPLLPGGGRRAQHDGLHGAAWPVQQTMNEGDAEDRVRIGLLVVAEAPNRRCVLYATAPDESHCDSRGHLFDLKMTICDPQPRSYDLDRVGW